MVEDKNEKQKSWAEFYRTMILFFAGIFFTCVVGIIELLPEFETVTGVVGKITTTVIYFGLLLGIIFSVNTCFRLYDMNKYWGGKYGFIFPTIEFFHIGNKYLTKKQIKWLLIVGFSLVFFVLYLVKIGILL